MLALGSVRQARLGERKIQRACVRQQEPAMIQRLRTSGSTVPVFENRTGISRLTAHGVGGRGGRWKRRRRLCHTHTFRKCDQRTIHAPASSAGLRVLSKQKKVVLLYVWCARGVRHVQPRGFGFPACFASPCKRGARGCGDALCCCATWYSRCVIHTGVLSSDQ